MVDKLPEGPKAEERKLHGMFGDDVVAAAEAPRGRAQPPRPEVAKGPAKKKGWDRSGQISVVLGTEGRERLDRVWKKHGIEQYDTRADLIRAAIERELDRLER